LSHWREAFTFSISGAVKFPSSEILNRLNDGKADKVDRSRGAADGSTVDAEGSSGMRSSTMAGLFATIQAGEWTG
jgi:hypothetical protein